MAKPTQTFEEQVISRLGRIETALLGDLNGDDGDDKPGKPGILERLRDCEGFIGGFKKVCLWLIAGIATAVGAYFSKLWLGV